MGTEHEIVLVARWTRPVVNYFLHSNTAIVPWTGCGYSVCCDLVPQDGPSEGHIHNSAVVPVRFLSVDGSRNAEGWVGSACGLLTVECDNGESYGDDTITT